jgi:hypothetical protein
MKSSFEGFQKTFEGLSGAGDKGFGQIFKDFSEQMKEMIDSYREAIRVIDGLNNGTIAPNL